jgi:hypothetical protein
MYELVGWRLLNSCRQHFSGILLPAVKTIKFKDLKLLSYSNSDEHFMGGANMQFLG